MLATHSRAGSSAKAGLKDKTSAKHLERSLLADPVLQSANHGNRGKPFHPRRIDVQPLGGGGSIAGVAAPAFSLAKRELVRFLRQRHRIIGALATPIVFWIFIGAGMGRAFTSKVSWAGRAASYRQYFFPGTVLMILLFTAIFSTISIIEDRREGFLQSVLGGRRYRGWRSCWAKFLAERFCRSDKDCCSCFLRR